MDSRDNPKDPRVDTYEKGLAKAITRNLFDTDSAVADLNPRPVQDHQSGPSGRMTPAEQRARQDDPEQNPVPPGAFLPEETDPRHQYNHTDVSPDGSKPRSNGDDLKWLDEPQTLYLRKKLHVHDAPSFVGNLAQILSSSCVKDAMKKVKLMADLIASTEKAPYPVFAIDSDGKVIAWNKEMEQLTEVPAHDMIGKGDHAYAVPFYGKPHPMLIDYLILPHTPADNATGTVPGTRDVLSAKPETVRLKGNLVRIQCRGTRIYDDEGSIVAAVQSIGIDDLLPPAQQPAEGKPLPERKPAYHLPPECSALMGSSNAAPSPQQGRVQPFPPEERGSAGVRLPAGNIRDQALWGQIPGARHEELRTAVGQLTAKEDVLLRNIEKLSEDPRVVRERGPASGADLYEHVVMEAREGIIAYDTSLRCILWNTFMEQLTGLTAAEVTGKRAFDMFPALKDAGAYLLLEQARSGKTVESADISCHIPVSGKQTWVRLIVSALRDRTGTVTGIIVIVQDTTARKVMEYALQTTIMQLMESEEKYRSVFNSKNDPLLLIDTTSRSILDLNNAIADLYGYSREEFFALSPASLFTEPEKYHDLLDRKSPGIWLCRQRKKDGTVFPADISYAYFELKGHTVLILSIRDLSTAYQTADALRLANTKLNLLIGVTRHDVINNLTVLMGYNDLMRHTVRDAKILDMLDKEESALKAVHRQIDFTREYYNLGVKSPLWQNICETSTRAYSQFITTVAFTCDTHDLEIYADPLLEKVFYNLFDNAIRHGDRITQIRIYCVREGSDLLLIFGDDGQGILPENKERIFSRGFGKHTGLGLFLTREILAITRIEITETGEYEKGARFELRIPQGLYRFPGSGKPIKVSGSESMNLHA
ncbi:MAG TPA: PAS domain S-box protein [Methanoregula sp.]|nr:PAS domain S-box protein [Methanoregula sp.]